MNNQNMTAGFHPAVRQLLEKPFEANQLKQIPSKWDRTKMLTYVMPEPVIRRLNDAFNSAWSFEIKHDSVTWNTVAGKVTVVVRILAQHFVPDPNGNFHLVTTFKDGIGEADLKPADGGGYIDVGLDLKSAVTDGLKLACKLFGVALDLYERKDEGMVAGNDGAKAQQFQIEKIDRYFGSCGIGQAQWLGRYNLQRPEDMPLELANSLLNGTHPDVVMLAQNTGKTITGGIRASNA
jgi:hypothetical protein